MRQTANNDLMRETYDWDEGRLGSRWWNETHGRYWLLLHKMFDGERLPSLLRRTARMARKYAIAVHIFTSHPST